MVTRRWLVPGGNRELSVLSQCLLSCQHGGRERRILCSCLCTRQVFPACLVCDVARHRSTNNINLERHLRAIHTLIEMWCKESRRRTAWKGPAFLLKGNFHQKDLMCMKGALGEKIILQKILERPLPTQNVPRSSFYKACLLLALYYIIFNRWIVS